MADYKDYLEYLHHIDDMTMQEFKKKEDELRHQIDVVRDQCQKEINGIKENSEAEKAQMKASHKAELAKLKEEKDAAVENLSATMAQFEDEKKNAVEQALAKVNADHESAVSALRYQYQSFMENTNAEIKQLKESHERELQKITAEKDAQILKLTNKLAKIEAEKFSFRKVMNKIKEFILSLFMNPDSYINGANGTTRFKFYEKLRHTGEDSSPAGEEHRFCRVCGNPLKPGAVFCNKCGSKVN